VEIAGARLAVSNERFWPLVGHDPARFKITSAVYSPRLEKNIAMALVPVDLTAEGTRLQFSAPFGTLDARVVAMPFYNPKKSLAKG